MLQKSLITARRSYAGEESEKESIPLPFRGERPEQAGINSRRDLGPEPGIALCPSPLPGGTQTSGDTARFRQTAVWTLANVDTTSRGLYGLLLQDVFVPQDLLDPFKQRCRRERTDLTDVSPERLWKGLYHRKIDYPKLADLYWKLLLNKVKTGEPWMEHHDCPRCQTLQVAEHLFWHCPIAKAVWDVIRRIWRQITDRPLNLPTTWTDLLVKGVTSTDSRFFSREADRERLQLLFGEALWSLWLYRYA